MNRDDIDQQMEAAIEQFGDVIIGTTRAFKRFSLTARNVVAEQIDRLSWSQRSRYWDLRRHGEPILNALIIATRKR